VFKCTTVSVKYGVDDERAVTDLEKDLGYQWATTVLAFLALAMAP
jgi:hypothetical protein